MSDNKATWIIELYTDCPSCKEYVNLLDYVDFWDGIKLDFAEHGTERSENVRVVCPECEHVFFVDLEY